jgi:hypothetical protein
VPQQHTNAAAASVLQFAQSATSWVQKHNTNSAAIAPRPVSRTDARGSSRGAGLAAGRFRAAAGTWVCIIEPRAPGLPAGPRQPAKPPAG